MRRSVRRWPRQSQRTSVAPRGVEGGGGCLPLFETAQSAPCWERRGGSRRPRWRRIMRRSFYCTLRRTGRAASWRETSPVTRSARSASAYERYRKPLWSRSALISRSIRRRRTARLRRGTLLCIKSDRIQRRRLRRVGGGGGASSWTEPTSWESTVRVRGVSSIMDGPRFGLIVCDWLIWTLSDLLKKHYARGGPDVLSTVSCTSSGGHLMLPPRETLVTLPVSTKGGKRWFWKVKPMLHVLKLHSLYWPPLFPNIFICLFVDR